MRRANAIATATVAIGLFVGCGGGEGASTQAICEPSGTSLRVVASAGQFDADCFAVPASQPFTVTFSNEDAGHHNFTIKDGGDTVLVVVAAPGEAATSEGPPLESDTYGFLCTIHPVMKGTFVAA